MNANRGRRVRMKRWAGLGLLLGLLSASSFGIVSVRGRPQEPKTSDVVVHEWGTFLAMNGSDGVGLEGMYHEEHALPGFVHARSRDQLRLPSVVIKGETPVIYFYTDRPQKVRVDVRFPKGIWTQWYPQARKRGRGDRGRAEARPPAHRAGTARWRSSRPSTAGPTARCR